MFWVYILRCADGSNFTGLTDNLPRCVEQHQLGMVGYTARRLPVALLWSQTCVTYEEARTVELQARSRNLAPSALAPHKPAPFDAAGSPP